MVGTAFVRNNGRGGAAANTVAGFTAALMSVLAHAACAERGEDLVWAETGTRREGHGWRGGLYPNNRGAPRPRVESASRRLL